VECWGLPRPSCPARESRGSGGPSWLVMWVGATVSASAYVNIEETVGNPLEVKSDRSYGDSCRGSVLF